MGNLISPGEILNSLGQNFEPGMRVNFDALSATPLYITPTQRSIVAPPGLAGARETNVRVEMRSTPVKIRVWPARPGLFTAGARGKGPAAARKGGLWQLNVRIPEFATKTETGWRARQRESPEGATVALRE